MPRLRTVATIAFSAALLAAPARAADIEGVWMRPNGEAKMKIEPCGDAVCGVLVWLKEPKKDVNNPDPSKRDRPLLGSTMLYDLKLSDEPGVWKGRLYDAENGKTYKGEVHLVDGKLDMKGCVAFFCDDEKWTRASP
jgi:uncharacterized protein (DUF2147 family)